MNSGNQLSRQPKYRQQLKFQAMKIVCLSEWRVIALKNLVYCFRYYNISALFFHRTVMDIGSKEIGGKIQVKP